MYGLDWKTKLFLMISSLWILRVGILELNESNLNWFRFFFGIIGIPVLLWALAWILAWILTIFIQSIKKKSTKNPKNNYAKNNYEEHVNDTTNIAKKENIPIWSRFFARFLDYYIFTRGTILAITVIFPEQIQNIIDSKSEFFVSYIIGTIGGAILLTFCMSITGTTIGKYLFRLQISDLDNNELTEIRMFKREMMVFFKGWALGLPVLYLLSMVKAHGDLKEKGFTSWDLRLLTKVSQKRIGPIRMSLNIVFIICFIGGIEGYAGYLETIENQEKIIASKVVKWENPLTKKSISLPKYWNSSDDKLEPDSLLVASFSNDNAGLARFMHEELPFSANLEHYVKLLIKTKQRSLNERSLNHKYSFTKPVTLKINGVHYKKFFLKSESLGNFEISFSVWKDKNNPKLFWHTMFTQSKRSLASESFDSLLKLLHKSTEKIK